MLNNSFESLFLINAIVALLSTLRKISGKSAWN